MIDDNNFLKFSREQDIYPISDFAYTKDRELKVCQNKEQINIGEKNLYVLMKDKMKNFKSECDVKL